MLIGHRKERNSLRWPIYIINSVDRTKVAINSDQMSLQWWIWWCELEIHNWQTEKKFLTPCEAFANSSLWSLISCWYQNDQKWKAGSTAKTHDKIERKRTAIKIYFLKHLKLGRLIQLTFSLSVSFFVRNSAHKFEKESIISVFQEIFYLQEFLSWQFYRFETSCNA